MALTDRAVRTTKPTAKVQYIADGDGLYLKVLPSGTKTWMVRSQAGRDRWESIGRYPAMTLLEARNEARARLRVGLHQTTLRAAYDAYAKTLPQNYDRPELITARLEADIVPKLGKKRLAQITRQDVAGALQAIVDRGSPVQANRTLADVSHLFEFCVARGWIGANPAAGITRRSVGGREIPRDRVLSEDEIIRLVGVLKTPRLHVRTRLSLVVLLLTGQRTGEVIGLSTGEIKSNWWLIPAARTKSRRSHKVYLAPLTKGLLRLAFKWLGPQPFLADHRTLDKAVARLDFKPPFTPHDLRRTFATRLADLGVMPHVIEKMLNHRMEGTMAVYNRAEYLPEQRAAWRLWARYLRTTTRSK